MKTIYTVLTMLIFTSLFIGCGEKVKTEKKQNAEPVVKEEIYALNDSNWVSLEYNLFDPTFADSSRYLSEGERSLAEAIIFEKIKIEAPEIYKKRKLYKRQYFCGFKDKQILIYLNYFIDETDSFSDWKSKYVVLFDGGDNFFQIKLNWTEMKCYDFSINGEA